MQQRFTKLWQSIAASDADEEYAAIAKAYGESHRAYHNLEHIGDCLTQLDSAATRRDHPREVELAVWFHDVVYNTRSDQNEQESADWAARSLAGGGIAKERIALVVSLILATRHAAVPDGLEAQLIVDVDLSILGRPPTEFQEYEQKIRREYRWVPGIIFRRKRAEVLESFLGRPNIYSTEEFRDRYEEAARTNLADSIQVLRGG